MWKRVRLIVPKKESESSQKNEPVATGADATVFVVFLGQICKKGGHMLLHPL